MVRPSKNSQKTSKIKKLELPFACQQISNISNMTQLNDEPMYDLNDENIIKIRELIEVPFVSFGGVEKYETLEEKAAALFCATIRGHKFGNGNKRTAVILFLSFVAINKKWSNFSHEELYKLAMKIASNTDANFEEEIEELVELFRKKLVDQK